MVRLFTYIWHTNQPNVGKYTIHGYMDSMGGDSPVQPQCIQSFYNMAVHCVYSFYNSYNTVVNPL